LLILEGFTLGNKTNKALMWKYKETFIFPDLGSSEEDGELEFVLAIVEGNEKIATTKSLDLFIQNLNKRMGHASNFVILLDIFNKLMDFETSGKVKKSLIKLILEHPEMLESSKNGNVAEFEASVNVKEILFHILNNQELSYTRDSFISLFPMEEFVDRLDSSLKLLDTLEEDNNEDANEDDDREEDVKKEEYEELRNSHQKVLVSLYCNLHFNKNDPNVDIEKIMNTFQDDIAPYYHEKLDNFLKNVDITDSSNYKMSEVRLLASHLQILVKSINDCLRTIKDRKLSRLGVSQRMMLSVESNVSTLQAIQDKVEQLKKLLKTSDEDDIKDLIDEIAGKNTEDEDGIAEDDGSIGASFKINTSAPNGSVGNNSLKIGNIISNEESKTQNSKNIQMKNRRSEEAVGYGKSWNFYVNKISNSRYVRDLSNEEQSSVTDLIYSVLTEDPYDKSEELNITSIKKFIANIIDYACDCEKETWTAYLVIFVFKLLGNLLKK